MESCTIPIKNKTRSTTVCSFCRNTRRKCDGQSAPCTYCANNSLPCDRPAHSSRKKQKKKVTRTADVPRDLLPKPQSPPMVMVDLREATFDESILDFPLIDEARDMSLRFCLGCGLEGAAVFISFGFCLECSLGNGAADIAGMDLERHLAGEVAENESLYSGFVLENRAVSIESAHLKSTLPVELTLPGCPVEFTPSDLNALDRLRNEVLFSVSGTKNPKWSTVAILLDHGSHDPAVMHLLLAASLLELGWRYNSYSIVRKNADKHYMDGKNILVRMINADKEPDHLLVMISFWFWYLYHSKNPRKDRFAYLEMSNQMTKYFKMYSLDSILSTSTLRRQNSMQQSPRTRCLARLISWLFWADAAACFKGDGGVLARLLVRSSPGAILNIYDCAKLTLERHWGRKYPDTESLDDTKNRPLLDLINLTWVIVQNINEELESGPLDLTKTAKFGKQIEDLLLGKYANAVELARSRISLRDRELGNADWAVSNLYALCIYVFRCSINHEADAPILPPEVDKFARNPAYLIEIMDRSLDGSPIGQIDRFQWPLFWAGVETRDRIHQKWVKEKLISPDYSAALDTVLQEQSNTDLRIGIDRIREICREKYCGVLM